MQLAQADRYTSSVEELLWTKFKFKKQCESRPTKECV